MRGLQGRHRITNTSLNVNKTNEIISDLKKSLTAPTPFRTPAGQQITEDFSLDIILWIVMQMCSDLKHVLVPTHAYSVILHMHTRCGFELIVVLQFVWAGFIAKGRLTETDFPMQLYQQ